MQKDSYTFTKCNANGSDRCDWVHRPPSKPLKTNPLYKAIVWVVARQR